MRFLQNDLPIPHNHPSNNIIINNNLKNEKGSPKMVKPTCPLCKSTEVNKICNDHYSCRKCQTEWKLPQDNDN